MENEHSENAASASPGNFRYAGFWIRFLALLIDGIIIAIVSRILFGSQVSATPETGVNFQMSGQLNGWQNLVHLIYFIGFWIALSATPGKMACGLKIISQDGSKLRPAQAVGRYFAMILSGIILFIGFLMAGFDDRKRALHDRLAKTYVVHK
ncbi:RDD family protein [Candidatus Peregrinibacteria bacterium]|nr:RDD family protein [Candidatus Peregrinibacteria bacterium]